ncbi:M48 family metalloprotease [Pyrobaculum sp.]|uniref:M48 family metalloprotease n=1 Tax=Pyrobaculum sp. TaxID=2004705 RepID=UPI003164C3EE
MPLTLVIFAALINLLSRYMLGALGRFDKRGGYYIAEDSTARGSGKILNACVPILPALNAVVVSKSLLQALGDRELEAVLKHEEGHIGSRCPLFVTTALAAFYFTYHNVVKALDAYLGPSVLHLSAGLALGLALGVLYINTTLWGLERKADHYATANGYSEELKKALSRLPERSGLL